MDRKVTIVFEVGVKLATLCEIVLVLAAITLTVRWCQG